MTSDDQLRASGSGVTKVEGGIDGKPLKKDFVPKAPDNEYYEIRAVPGKGYGCFSTKDLKRGVRILADAPLLVVQEAHYLKSDIEEAFKKLSPAEQELFFSLASCHGQDLNNWPSKIHDTVVGREVQRIKEQHNARIGKEPSLVSIFQTNCMEMKNGAAVFPNAARFNHSCNPNATFTWNPAIQKETIHVMNDIKQGEEITLSYCDMAHEKTLRTWKLKHYGFVCSCRACAEDGDDQDTFAHKSAERRFRIAELDRATRFLRGPRLGEGAKQRDFVKQLLELASLHVQEGDYSVRLADVYLDLALVCEVAQDFKMGTTCAAKAVKVKRECQGEDFPDYVRYREVLRRINNKYKTAAHP